MIPMELRPELMPPALDEAMVQHLAKLASGIDGAPPGLWEEDLEEFNRVAGTSLPFINFQRIYGAEDHDTWVRRVLIGQAVRPAANVTRPELVEVVRRAMSQNGYADYEGYMAVFDANVSMPNASSLIYDPPDPPDYDPATNTWGGGRPIGEYNPPPEQIVEWALAYRKGEAEGDA